MPNVFEILGALGTGVGQGIDTYKDITELERRRKHEDDAKKLADLLTQTQLHREGIRDASEARPTPFVGVPGAGPAGGVSFDLPPSVRFRPLGDTGKVLDLHHTPAARERAAEESAYQRRRRDSVFDALQAAEREAEQRRLDRESRERIAGIGAAARQRTSRATVDPARRADLDDFNVVSRQIDDVRQQIGQVERGRPKRPITFLSSGDSLAFTRADSSASAKVGDLLRMLDSLSGVQGGVARRLQERTSGRQVEEERDDTAPPMLTDEEQRSMKEEFAEAAEQRTRALRNGADPQRVERAYQARLMAIVEAYRIQ